MTIYLSSRLFTESIKVRSIEEENSNSPALSEEFARSIEILLEIERNSKPLGRKTSEIKYVLCAAQ